MSVTAPAIHDSNIEPAFPRKREAHQTGDEPSLHSGTNPAIAGGISYRIRVSEELPQTARSQLPLPLDVRAKTVEGVVLTVDPASVSVRCRLPNRYVELTLPRILLPDELAHYGAAVTLEVDQDSTYRRLKIKARQVVETHTDSELDEIDEWIDKLGQDGLPRKK